SRPSPIADPDWLTRCASERPGPLTRRRTAPPRLIVVLVFAHDVRHDQAPGVHEELPRDRGILAQRVDQSSVAAYHRRRYMHRHLVKRAPIREHHTDGNPVSVLHSLTASRDGSTRTA